jgi:hypothetical protein
MFMTSGNRVYEYGQELVQVEAGGLFVFFPTGTEGFKALFFRVVFYLLQVGRREEQDTGPEVLIVSEGFGETAELVLLFEQGGG